MPDALVRFEILVLDSAVTDEVRLEKLKSIASARNAHNELDVSTIAHFLDYYKISVPLRVGFLIFSFSFLLFSIPLVLIK